MTNKISVKQIFFDRWAPSYDWLFPSVVYQAIHQRLLEYIDLPASANVLDLGCGTGKLLHRLAVNFPTLQGNFKWQDEFQSLSILPGGLKLYSPTAREKLGKEAGLNLQVNYYLLGAVLLTIFTKELV